MPSFSFIQNKKIVLIKHSLGSLIASIETSTYQNVNNIILSNTSHTINPNNTIAITNLYPTSLDPKFTRLKLPNNYFTTIPNTHNTIFYYQPNTNPKIITIDEQLKQTVSLNELLKIISTLPSSNDINVPTLVTVDDFDFFNYLPPSCTASDWTATELTNYPTSPCVKTTIIPNTGHDLNLHHNAPS